MRFCPQCSLILETVEWNGAPIHVCRSCGGCWIARGDFSRLANQNGGRFDALDALFPSAASAGMFEGLPKPCPDCRTVMLERRDAGLAGASPRTCPACQGVWLEAGEPGLRRNASEEPVTVNPPPVEAPTSVLLTVENAAEPAGQPDEPEEPFYLPEAVGPETVAESVEPVAEAEPVTAAPVPWLPHVSESMPDPRPMSRRGAPLTAEPADPNSGVVPAVVQPNRWCPQCRRAYYGSEAECATCRIGLAEGGYRVRCLRCGNENTIAAERCWSCHVRMHPDSDSPPPPAPPPLPAIADLRHWQRQSQSRPPGSGSCGAVFLWVFGGCVAAGLITLLLER